MVHVHSICTSPPQTRAAHSMMQGQHHEPHLLIRERWPASAPAHMAPPPTHTQPVAHTQHTHDATVNTPRLAVGHHVVRQPQLTHIPHTRSIAHLQYTWCKERSPSPGRRPRRDPNTHLPYPVHGTHLQRGARNAAPHLVVGHHVVRQPQLPRLRAPHAPPREEQLLGLAGAHQPRQPLCRCEERGNGKSTSDLSSENRLVFLVWLALTSRGGRRNEQGQQPSSDEMPYRLNLSQQDAPC